MTAKELQLLIDLRKRVEDEDWLGTCGDREQGDELEREHHEMLTRIDAVLRSHGRPIPSQSIGIAVSKSGEPFEYDATGEPAQSIAQPTLPKGWSVDFAEDKRSALLKSPYSSTPMHCGLNFDRGHQWMFNLIKDILGIKE